MTAKRKKPARYHHGGLRRALLDCVLAMVGERGDAGEVTLREVARRTKVSHAAPYRHFEDKTALLAALASEGFVKLSNALRAARRGVVDDEERFVRSGLVYLEFALEHPGYLAVMHGPDVAKARTPELQHAANDTFQILKELATDAGVVDAKEARQLGAAIWSFVYGLATLTSHGQVPASVGASADELARLGLGHLFRSARSGANERASASVIPTQ
jgi:AcrR family transcriptional regulator